MLDFLYNVFCFGLYEKLISYLILSTQNINFILTPFILSIVFAVITKIILFIVTFIVGYRVLTYLSKFEKYLFLTILGLTFTEIGIYFLIVFYLLGFKKQLVYLYIILAPIVSTLVFIYFIRLWLPLITI